MAKKIAGSMTGKFAIPDTPKTARGRILAARQGRISLSELKSPDEHLEVMADVWGKEWATAQKKQRQANIEAATRGREKRYKERLTGWQEGMFGKVDPMTGMRPSRSPLVSRTRTGQPRPYWRHEEEGVRVQEEMEALEMRRREALQSGMPPWMDYEEGKAQMQRQMEFGRGQGFDWDDWTTRNWYASPEMKWEAINKQQERAVNANKLLWRVAEYNARLTMTPDEYATFRQYKESWYADLEAGRIGGIGQEWEAGDLEELIGNLAFSPIAPLPLETLRDLGDIKPGDVLTAEEAADYGFTIPEGGQLVIGVSDQAAPVPDVIDPDDPRYQGEPVPDVIDPDDPRYQGEPVPDVIDPDDPRYQGEPVPDVIDPDDPRYQGEPVPDVIDPDDPRYQGEPVPDVIDPDDPRYQGEPVPDVIDPDDPRYQGEPVPTEPIAEEQYDPDAPIVPETELGPTTPPPEEPPPPPMETTVIYPDGTEYTLSQLEEIANRDWTQPQIMTYEQLAYNGLYFEDEEGNDLLAEMPLGTLFTVQEDDEGGIALLNSIHEDGWVFGTDGMVEKPDGTVITIEEFNEQQAKAENTMLRLDQLFRVLEAEGLYWLDVSPDITYTYDTGTEYKYTVLDLRDKDVQAMVLKDPKMMSLLLDKIKAIGHNAMTEDILRDIYGMGLEDENDFARFFGEYYQWTAPGTGWKWPRWLQTIVGGETGDGGLMAAIEWIDDIGQFVYGWAGSALTAPFAEESREYIFKRHQIIQNEGVAAVIWGDSAEEAFHDWGEGWPGMKTMKEWVIPMGNPFILAVPTAGLIRGGALVTRLAGKAGVVGSLARATRLMLKPIQGIETGIGFGVKWGFKLSLQYPLKGVFKMIPTGAKGLVSRGMQRVFEAAVSNNLTKWLATRGIRGFMASRTIQKFLQSDYMDFLKTAQRHISVGDDGLLGAAERTIADMDVALNAAYQEAKKIPVIGSDDALYRLAGETGYRVKKIAPKGQSPSYVVEGHGQSIVVGTRKEAANFIETNSTTGLSPSMKAERLRVIMNKEARTLDDILEAEAIMRELNPSLGDAAITAEARAASKGARTGRMENPAVADTLQDAKAVANRELIDDIPNSPTDKAAGAEMRSYTSENPHGNKQAYIDETPSYSDFRPQEARQLFEENIDEILEARAKAKEWLGDLEQARSGAKGKKATVYDNQIDGVKREIEWLDELENNLMDASYDMTLDDWMKAGVALKRTKAGKLTPAIRQSGHYVTDEFAAYTGFMDVKTIEHWIADPSRMLQAIDGGFFGGPCQKYILWPTRRTHLVSMMRNQAEKTRFEEKAAEFGVTSRRQRILVTRAAQQIETKDVNIANRILMRRKELREALGHLAVEEQDKIINFAKHMRTEFWDDAINFQNGMRAKLRRPLIKYRKGYSPEVARQNKLEEFLETYESGDVMRASSKPEYIKETSPWNPRAQPRKSRVRKPIEDCRELWYDYVDYMVKDAYNTNIIMNARAYTSFLRNSGYKSSATAIDNWITTRYVNPSKQHGWFWKAPFFIRRQLTRNVFPLNFSWNLIVQPSSYGLTVLRYGVVHAIQGLEYMIPRSAIRGVIQENCYSWIIKQSRMGKLRYQDLGGRIQKTSERRLGGLPEKVEDWAGFMTDGVEDYVTGASCVAAYRHGQRLGLKGRALIEYASDGGAKTQSMYNFLDQPYILAEGKFGSLIPFQTFSFELFNTMRETRVLFFMGKTGTYESIFASSVTGKALMRNRVKSLLEFGAFVWAWNEMAESVGGRKPWVVGSGIPAWNFLMAGATPNSPQSQLLPQAYVGDWKQAIDAVLKYNNWDKIGELFLRYHAIGGVQINRVVKTFQAMELGEVQDVKGETMFKVDSDDFLKGIFLGPYGTDLNVQRRLDMLMEDLGWSVEELAIETEYTPEFIQGLLDGTQEFTEEIRGRLAVAMDVSKDEFVGAEEYSERWRGEMAGGGWGEFLYDMTGIKFANRTDVKQALDEMEEMLGGVTQVDGDNKQVTMNSFASLVIQLQNEIGAKRQGELNQSTLAVKYMEDRETWEEYWDTPKEDRLEYRKKFPEVEASMFFWGEIATLHSWEALQYVETWMSTHTLPEEAIPALINIDDSQRRKLQLDSELREEDLVYDSLRTEDGRVDTTKRREYMDTHPEYALKYYEREAFKDEVPEEFVPLYAEYYAKRLTGNDAKRFMIGNPEYYQQVWLGVQNKLPMDLVNVPTIEDQKIIDHYESLTRVDEEGKTVADERARRIWRWEHHEEEQVLLKFEKVTSPIRDWWSGPEATEEELTAEEFFSEWMSVE